MEPQDNATENKSDWSKFKLTAWTDNPDVIPTTHDLRAAEPEASVIHENPRMEIIFGRLPPYLWKKNELTYQVLI